METANTEHDVGTVLINLDEVPLGEVLARRDDALALAVSRMLRPETDDDDQLATARFSNFV